MTINFYHGNVSVNRKNCVVLIDDTWNDWNIFRTMFSLVYYNESGDCTPLGRTKIGQKGLQNGRPEIPNNFTKLTDEYFSLGEGVLYYRELNNLSNSIKKEILIALNDIAYNTEKLEEIQKNKSCEIDVKLFTNDKIKDIYYTRTSPIKYLK